MPMLSDVSASPPSSEADRVIRPPCVPLAELDTHVRLNGYAALETQSVCELFDCELQALQAWNVFWDRLPVDSYLIDGGDYRLRRHASFVVNDGEAQPWPHRAHWQPLEYNPLHGGMERWFDPMEPELTSTHLWRRLLRVLAAKATALRGGRRWFVEAHQFRIQTTGVSGHPTPEGAHRDGVDLVAVILVQRVGVRGGETRVFEAQGSFGRRFTLKEPWTLLLLDDSRVIHESTPVQPSGEKGFRDTLVLTFRAESFLGASRPRDPVSSIVGATWARRTG